jgi:hypothetical protein
LNFFILPGDPTIDSDECFLSLLSSCLLKNKPINCDTTTTTMEEELRLSVEDVKEFVHEISIQENETIHVVTLEKETLFVQFSLSGYFLDEVEYFETLNDLLMKKSNLYKKEFKNKLLKELSKL